MLVLERDRTLEQLRELLADEAAVQFAYLYGSRAQGLARADSDVDIAAYFAPGDILDAYSLQERLERQLHVPVQAIDLAENAALEFFERVFPKAILIKDAPERRPWEWEMGYLADLEPGTLDDYLAFVLDSMQEKNELLRQALPLLDQIDLVQVKQGDLEIASGFIGKFFIVFQPLETVARRIANYVHLTEKVSVPPELKGQVQLLVNRVGMDDAAFAPLFKMVNVRNRVAHAYWDLKEEELNNRDLRAARQVLDELTRRVDLFVETAQQARPAAAND